MSDQVATIATYESVTLMRAYSGDELLSATVNWK
jgi:hypothetical protein